jgi:hypothetical protein
MEGRLIMSMIGYDSNTGELGKVPDDDAIMKECPSDPPDDATVNGGDVQYRYDSKKDEFYKEPPEPNEAKQSLFTKAEAPEFDGGWGWSRSKLRTVRREEGLFFDFLDANNYEEAKLEATDSDNLTDSETQWVHDLLSGATWEQDW